MEINIKISPEDVAPVVEAVARRHNYHDRIQDPMKPEDPEATIPNPESKAQFVKRWLINCLKNEVSLDLLQQEQRAAQDRAIAGMRDLDII